MPELPEVETTARLIGEAVKGNVVTKATAPGIGALKSYDPALDSIEGSAVRSIYRRGKHLLISFSNETTMLSHLMSAGRLQLFEGAASLRDRTVRVTISLNDGRQLRFREFGTKHRAWVKLLRDDSLSTEESLATLGPEAYPVPSNLRSLLNSNRTINALLRDQHVIAGLGRSWTDEILHTAKLSPFKRGSALTDGEGKALAGAIDSVISRVLAHYEDNLEVPIPDKYPMPLRVHRNAGQPCPECGTAIEAVSFEDYEMCYCPYCQTGGKVLADRRLSRLLK